MTQVISIPNCGAVALQSGSYVRQRDAFRLFRNRHELMQNPDSRFSGKLVAKVTRNVPQVRAMDREERKRFNAGIARELGALVRDSPVEIEGIRRGLGTGRAEKLFGLIVGLEFTKQLIIGSGSLLSISGLHAGIGKMIENFSNLTMMAADWIQVATGVALAFIILRPRKLAEASEPIIRFAEQVAGTIDNKLGEHGSANGNAAPVPTQN